MLLRSLIRGTAVAAAALAGAASPALASHLQGGSIVADVTATGHLQGTLIYADAYGCTIGQQSSQQVTITAPTNQTAVEPVTLKATRCIPGSATYTGTFDVPLDTSTFASGAPDGAYVASWRAGNRVGGIVNLANSSSGNVSYATRVSKVAMQASGAPRFGSNVANGIAIGSEYKQNLNAVDPDGGTITYATKVKPDDPDAPDSDVVMMSPSGKVTIPASETATFTGGQFYIYKVRATDVQGDYTERDVLLKVASTNHQPAFAGLEASYAVTAGKRLEIPVSATDPDSGDAVTIASGALPSWATLTSTPGNPAQATLVVEPPAGTSGMFGINLDAQDDSADVVLTDAAYTEIVVREPSKPAPPPTAPAVTAPAPTAAGGATFTFTGAAGSTFQCRVDGGAWAACTSPHTVSGLQPGRHTFEVRQIDASGQASPATSTSFDVAGLALVTIKGGPKNVRATGVLPGTLNVKTGALKAGCSLPGVTSCKVDVFVKKARVGTGTATADGRGGAVTVPLKLNARGKRLVRRSGGIAARFQLTAQAGGSTFTTSAAARILPQRATTIVRDGLPGRARTTYLRVLKRELADAKTVTCVGHSAAARSAKTSAARGLASARAFCATIAGFEIDAKLSSKSAGASHPRASNSTAAGRAFNDRVELRITY